MIGARRRARAARLEEQVRHLQEQIEAADTVVRALVSELAIEDPSEAGRALALRLEHGLLHAEALTEQAEGRTTQALADLRSSTRLTQALVERALAVPSGDRPASGSGAAPFVHATPSFDLLYRAFEDRHRGSHTVIAERLREDYLDAVAALPHRHLPVADLGCGRGELVEVLDEAGIIATGVDTNLGQLAELEHGAYVNRDLFDWLDEQADESHRALLAIHVVEHLPLELQVRLVFETRRVLADGGLLVLETPNVLSLSTAATNFWVDPTHQRPVHPLFLDFLAHEAGFARVESHPRHEVPVRFRGADVAPELVADLDSLILGAGDLSLLAWR